MNAEDNSISEFTFQIVQFKIHIIIIKGIMDCKIQNIFPKLRFSFQLYNPKYIFLRKKYFRWQNWKNILKFKNNFLILEKIYFYIVKFKI